MIRVLVADDHPIVRAGIVGLLSAAADIEVVGEAVDGLDAVRLAGSLEPDLVLMDLRMPALDGAEATARIITHARPRRCSCSPRTRPTSTSSGRSRPGRRATC